jgi:hypothetical protein
MGGKGGEGTEACESVAESDKHIKWKNLAAGRLLKEFNDNVKKCRVELPLKAPTSDNQRRVGDAVLVFDEVDEQLGEGIVVEVQHKNHSKDIEATTADYISQNYSVVWTDGSDYSKDHFRLAEIDLRKRAQEAAWPGFVPEKDKWWTATYNYQNQQQKWTLRFDSGVFESRVPATLPTDWVDEESKRIWREQCWETIFSPPEPRYLFRQGNQTKVPATFSPDIVKEEIKAAYRNAPWDKIVSQKTKTDELLDVGKSVVEIPVNFPKNIESELQRRVETKAVEDPPERPNTCFDDVQCHVCGCYWYIEEERDHCERCGTKVDFHWNKATNRISEIPDYAESTERNGS